MKLSQKLIEDILSTLDTHPHNFVMVSDLALKVNEMSNEGGSALSDKFVNHMLHLQDLRAFENNSGMSSFGHKASRDNSTPEGFSHCYTDQLIRINASGRELLDLLENESISEKSKKSALRIGGDIVSAILIKAITNEL